MSQLRFITQRHVNILLVVFTDVVCYISQACRVDIIFPDPPVFDVDCSILYGYADMRICGYAQIRTHSTNEWRRGRKGELEDGWWLAELLDI